MAVTVGGASPQLVNKLTKTLRDLEEADRWAEDLKARLVAWLKQLDTMGPEERARLQGQLEAGIRLVREWVECHSAIHKRMSEILIRIEQIQPESGISWEES